MTRRLRRPAPPRCWTPRCYRLRAAPLPYCPSCLARLPEVQARSLSDAWDGQNHVAFMFAVTAAQRWLADHPAEAV